MGRELKRVPLDFDWPINKIWPGYMVSFETLIERYNQEMSAETREQLELQFARLMGCPLEGEGDFQYADYTFLEPPTGEGYQLWETTSEGSPQSPVFPSLDELCAWCESNATTFGSATTSAPEWKRMLSEGMVYHQKGNAIFL